MKKGYVIKSEMELKRKDGSKWLNVAYFEVHRSIFNVMTSDITKAAFYDKKILAQNDLKRYFSGQKEIIIPYTKPKN